MKTLCDKIEALQVIVCKRNEFRRKIKEAYLKAAIQEFNGIPTWAAPNIKNAAFTRKILIDKSQGAQVFDLGKRGVEPVPLSLTES
jgi:hypothetical protein